MPTLAFEGKSMPFQKAQYQLSLLLVHGSVQGEEQMTEQVVHFSKNAVDSVSELISTCSSASAFFMRSTRSFFALFCRSSKSVAVMIDASMSQQSQKQKELV